MKRHLNTLKKAAQTVELAEYEEELTYLWGQILYKTGKLEQASEKIYGTDRKFSQQPFRGGSPRDYCTHQATEERRCGSTI